MTKNDLPRLLESILIGLGGSGTIIEVSKKLWEDYEDQLASSGDIFYTWQYDIRWAAHILRKEGIMKDAATSDRGVWELKHP